MALAHINQLNGNLHIRLYNNNKQFREGINTQQKAPPSRDRETAPQHKTKTGRVVSVVYKRQRPEQNLYNQTERDL